MAARADAPAATGSEPGEREASGGKQPHGLVGVGIEAVEGRDLNWRFVVLAPMAPHMPSALDEA